VEALEFEGWLDSYEELGVRIVGCSVDTLEAQQAFAEKLQLRFPLLADPDRSVCLAYGVVETRDAVAPRSTVLVGQDGVVRRVYAPAPAKGHAERVLLDLKAEG